MDRSTARAAGVSIALHAVVLSGALLIRAHLPDGAGQPAIIDATLVFDTGELSSRASATATIGAEPAPPSPVAAVAPVESPAADTEPAADAPLAAEPSPPAAEPAAGEPDAARDVLAVEETAEKSSAQAPTVADLVATESPAAETAAEPALAAVAAVATAPVARAGRSEEIPTREHAMLSRRFESWTGRFAPGETEAHVTWRQHGQAYTAVYRPMPAGDATDVERIVVDVSTEQGGKKLSTELTMTRLSFSSFAQFVDRWNPEVQIHDDEIDGRFHSNTTIKVLSEGRVSPVFHGKVTLASRDIDTDSSWTFSRRQVFPDGVETGVHRIMLPSRFLSFLNEAAKGDAHVQRFERDARITFYEDGTYGWSYVRDGGDEERRPVTSPAHYLLGLEGATLRIKGTVRGKVLVYSADRIVIDNDVRYAHAHDAPDLDDYLGLVAETSVEIAEPEVTGLGDLKIDGSIYARREFAVREFRSRESGTLRIFGSLAAGSLTATEPRFATKIEFDPRLTNARPPSFPLTDRYELESWDGKWRVDDDAGGDAEADADASVAAA
ncbi:MAG TPA: hypothetical protein VMU03_15170, partial [Gammaproteobacteria bacterium]|nr:hypothetical protein [Gammaproteobacteria bacterium]